MVLSREGNVTVLIQEERSTCSVSVSVCGGSHWEREDWMPLLGQLILMGLGPYRFNTPPQDGW